MTDRLHTMLAKPGRIRARIREEELRKERLYYSLLPSGIRYDAEKVKSSPRDPMPAYIAEAEEIDELIRSLKDMLRDAENEILSAITVLDTTEAMIIRLRYVDGLSWEKVAREVNYSRAHTFRLYRDIIVKLDQSMSSGK